MTSKSSLFLRPALGLAVLVAFAMASPASAEMVNYTADLKGSNEVPPNDLKGTGSFTGTFDTATKKLTYTVTYSGLSGIVTAAHIHGPSAASANAPVAIGVQGSTASPIKNEPTLTDAQAADLVGGRMYFNIHTAAHPGGEIRGQLLIKK